MRFSREGARRVVSPDVIAMVVWGPHVNALPWSVFPLMYVSPDQILPVLSLLGGALGFVLMAWNRLVGVFRRGKKPSVDH
jgi:hypothetical protein